MSSNITFTSVDRVIAKFQRDLRGTDMNESDLIEWIGEALEFLKVPQIQEQAVAFMEVENFEAVMPVGFHMILQMARNNKWTKESTSNCGATIEEAIEDLPKAHVGVPMDCQGNLLGDYEVAYYRPFFDLRWEFQGWNSSRTFRSNYTPIRVASNSFFNSIVCKEKDMSLYDPNGDEYTIVGTIDKKLRFSFQEGFVAMAYLRSATDPETGYPLVPDNISYQTAITYYIKWKMAEWYDWNGRAGFKSLAAEAEAKWLKYARQGKNFMKMPKTLEDFQDLMEQSHTMLPNYKKYQSFFGNRKRY